MRGFLFSKCQRRDYSIAFGSKERRGPIPKEMETKEAIKRLQKEEWAELSGKGSHVVFGKDGITISVHTFKRELPIGTYRNTAKTAGWL